MAIAHHHLTKYSKEETDRYADVYNHKIHYNDVGSGPALFCFHGGGPGSNAWDNTKHNLDDLAEHFRCIIMDMPGYGQSDKDVKRGDEPLDIFCAKVILGLMDHLGIDKAHLYGSSQFSACCLRFGIENPERTGKIVIQASGVGGRSYFTPGQTFGGKMLGVTAANPTRENMATLMHEFIPRDECTSLAGPRCRLLQTAIWPRSSIGSRPLCWPSTVTMIGWCRGKARSPRSRPSRTCAFTCGAAVLVTSSNTKSARSSTAWSSVS